MSEEKYEVRIRPEKEAIVAEMKEKAGFPGRSSGILQQTGRKECDTSPS